MATSQSVIEQFNKEFGIKQLTSQDNTCLFCNSNHYSKKTKQIVIKQTMNTQDEAAWEREFKCVEAKQKQRKPVGIIGASNARKEGLVIYAASTQLLWEKTGTEYEK